MLKKWRQELRPHWDALTPLGSTTLRLFSPPHSPDGSPSQSISPENDSQPQRPETCFNPPDPTLFLVSNLFPPFQHIF